MTILTLDFITEEIDELIFQKKRGGDSHIDIHI